MRATTLLSAIAAITLGQSAMSAVTVPTLGAGTPTFSASAPTGNSYLQLHLVATANQVEWDTKSGYREFQITPAADGSVSLNLGATVRWDAWPTDTSNGNVDDFRRYFAIGYSTNGGTTKTFTNVSDYYPKDGYKGSPADMPVGQWTRVERTFNFNVQTVDGSNPVTWYYRDDRALHVARYVVNLNPIDVGFDDLTVTVNGGPNLLTSGNFEYDQATLNTRFGFWNHQATSTQTISAVPEPTSLVLLAAPALLAFRRRQRA